MLTRFFISRPRLPHCLLALMIFCYVSAAWGAPLPGQITTIDAEPTYECGSMQGLSQPMPNPNGSGRVVRVVLYGSGGQVELTPKNMLFPNLNNVANGAPVYTGQTNSVHFICRVPQSDNAATVPYLTVNTDLGIKNALAQSGVALEYQVNGGNWLRYGNQPTSIELTGYTYKPNKQYPPYNNKYLNSNVKITLRFVRDTSISNKVSDYAGNTPVPLFYISPRKNDTSGNAMPIKLANTLGALSLNFKVARCAASVSFDKPSLNFGIMTSNALESGKAAVPFTISLHKTASCDGQTYSTDYDIPRIFVTFTSDHTINSQKNITLTDDSSETKTPLNLQLSIHKLNVTGSAVAFGQQVKFEDNGDQSMGAKQLSKSVRYSAVVSRENPSLPVNTGKFDTLIIATITYY